MSKRRGAAGALTVALGWVLALPAGAQQEEQAPGRPWHDARRLRALVQAGAAEAADSLRLATLELELGNPETAARLAAALRSSRRGAPDVLVVAARADQALGRSLQAAERYAQAAAATAGVEAGVLHARAADAYERAGRADRAAVHYREGRTRLPAIAAWLALREAGVVTSVVRAYELLRLTPEPARGIAQQIRAERLLQAGDTARAVRALADADRPVSAARLALVRADTTAARELAFRALATASVGDAQIVFREMASLLEAPRAVHGLLLADAYRRVGEHDAGIRALQGALRALGPNARGLRMLGDAFVDAGRFEEADSAYADAEAFGGTEGGTAAFRRAVMDGGGRDRAAYRAALLSFAERFPTHAAAARAVWLAAEDLRNSGRPAPAAELYRQLDASWPESSVAASARLALAEWSRRAGDLNGAATWYRREMVLQGAERHAANYLLASLQRARGATTDARALWEALADADPWGYHGAMARRALGRALPRLGSNGDAPPTERVRAELGALDLLVRSGLDREASLALGWLLTREDFTADEQLALAAGLIARGWTEAGVGLGWRVARERSLGDPAVLRVVFPWPYRDLIEREAAEHAVDPYLLAALIRQESTFRPQVTSRAGARGMMQLMPSTARWLAERGRLEWDERLLTVPDVNVHLGAAHLAALLAAYDGDELAALAAYNAGGRPTGRWRQSAAGEGPFEFVRSITYTETRGYVQAVVRNRDLYRALYPPGDSAGDS